MKIKIKKLLTRKLSSSILSLDKEVVDVFPRPFLFAKLVLFHSCLSINNPYQVCEKVSNLTFGSLLPSDKGVDNYPKLVAGVFCLKFNRAKEECSEIKPGGYIL